MKGSSRLAWAAALALVLSGCALVPPEPIVTGPLTAPPPTPVPPASTDRNGSASMNIGLAPAILPTDLGPKQNFETGSGNKSEGKGSSSATNVFSGTLTTTVIGVLPNGNLQVAGEKQIAINRGSEYVRFSGVVDPRSITGNNTVSSTQVADARIEYRSKGVMDEVQTMGWLQRFFLNIAPF